MDILVIGAGVSGLTTGVRLLQAGHSVTIWAKSFPPATTSNVAAAVWYPYKAHPADKVTAWGGEAFQAFKQLRSVEAAGIMMAEVAELKSVTSPDPWWAAAVDGFRHAHPEELPPGYADGYVFAAPVIDMSIYLVYLVRQFESLGGTLVQHTLTDLGEAFARSAAVVNCSGLGARELVGDRDIRPSRGQVLRIAHTGFRRVLLDDDGPNQVAYIVPRINDIVIGGTDIEGSESTDIDPTQSADILRRCAVGGALRPDAGGEPGGTCRRQRGRRVRRFHTGCCLRLASRALYRTCRNRASDAGSLPDP